jgi:hypothetical protein
MVRWSGDHSPTFPTLANMRQHGCRDLLIYCSNAPRCWHSGKMNADIWPDDTPFAEIERRMVCTKCGIIGAELRPARCSHLEHHNWMASSSN